MSIKINLNLDNDFVEILKNELSKAHYSIDTNDAEEIKIQYFNYKKKIINAKPRKILKSALFAVPSEFQRGLNDFESKITSGESLTPHLSKYLHKDYNDAMLNDWNIYHFHLGVGFESSGFFVPRTRSVLYAMIDENNFYFIAIGDHGEWIRQSMLKTVYSNWPKLISPYIIKGIKGVSLSPTDDDIKLLRKKGWGYIVEVSPNKFISSLGGGYLMSGVSIEVMRNVNESPKLLQAFDEKVHKNSDFISDTVGRVEGAEINLKLVLHDNEFAIQDRESETLFLLGVKLL